MPKTIVPFSWYGGKCSHVKWLLPLIENTEHKSYIEPYGGSAAILLHKKPSEIETYNDLYGLVCNFFKVLRDQTDELIAKLELTPYSREEFGESCNINYDDKINDIEKARLFFVKARQVRSGMSTKCTVKNWSYAVNQSRRKMSQSNSRWLSSIDGLWDTAERLKLVQIENDNAVTVIKRYDTNEALFYLDPPYVPETRTQKDVYCHEMSITDHEELLDTLLSVNGKVILSGYSNDLYNQKLKDWSFKDFDVHLHGYDKSEKTQRKERVWANFDINRVLNNV